MTASTERRGATLAVLCAMALMIVLDSTVSWPVASAT
jgi:hypothetical protein